MNHNLRRFGPLLVGATGAAGLAMYYAKAHNSANVHGDRKIIRPIGYPAWIKSIHPEAFSLSCACGHRGQGDVRTSNHLLLPEDECEALLKKQESSTVVQRAGNMVVRWDIGVVGSNSPCEDRYAVDLLPRSELPGLRKAPNFWEGWGGVRRAIKVNKDEVGGGNVAEEGDGSDDLLMFSVVDGHNGGPDMAELLRKVLHPTIAFAVGAQIWPSAHTFRHLVGDLGFPGLPITKGDITQALHDVLLALDNDILRAPLTLLRNCLPDPNASPLLPSPAPSFVHLARLSDYGACTTTAMVDIAEDKLYVANVGDCRAVAGWLDPFTHEWRCDVLTRIGDCDGDNEEGPERCRIQHPASERDDVVCDLGGTARVLGDYQITRAFGDNSMKGQIKDKADLEDAFDSKYSVNKKPYLTPPYMSAEPDIVCRDLHPASGEQLKFVVLATDGLWDSLSSEEATHLLSAHLEVPLGPDVPKPILPLVTPQKLPFGERPFPVEDLPGTTPETSQGDWVFRDTNAATHLIRNCLGRGNDWERRRLLSLKDGLVRGMRDDITTIVVRFDEREHEPIAPDSVQPGTP